jgi:regulatory protein YycI of two-component signal transduction system YycFG
MYAMEQMYNNNRISKYVKSIVSHGDQNNHVATMKTRILEQERTVQEVKLSARQICYNCNQVQATKETPTLIKTIRFAIILHDHILFSASVKLLACICISGLCL